MAKRPASVVRTYIDQYDVSGYVNAASQEIAQQTPVVGTFSDAGPRRLTDNYDHTHSHDGFIDTADDSYDEVMFSHLQTASDYHWGRFWEGIGEGAVAYEAVVRQTDQPRSVQVGQAILLNVSAAGSGHLARGVVLRSGTVSGTTNSTGQNVGATTSGQILVATFRVISGTFASVTLNIQESQNDGGADPYATISGMTSGSMTAAGVVRTTTTAATEAWKRVNVSAFSGTSCVVLVTLTLEALTA